MLRSEKAAQIEGIRDQFQRMSSAVFVDYCGLTVAQISSLRDQFRAKGVEYKVLKNTLLALALEEEAFAKDLAPVLKGMTGVAWSYEEPSAAARIVKAFVKDNDKLKIKAGILDGKILSPKAVENDLASLPSKDEARSALLAQLLAPAGQFVRLLTAPTGNMVRVLHAKSQL